MKKSSLVSTALATLLMVGAAHAAPLSVSASVGGAPTGVTLDNLDSLTVGGGSPQVSATGITIAFDPDAAVVTGSSSGIFASPFLSGGNGTGFGAPNQPNGVDTTPYLTSGSTGSFSGAQMVMTLPGQEKYFGLLWGSVDAYNTLSFYDGNTLIGSITGSDVLASPNGDQGVNGTVYVNINSTVAFNKVVATSSQYAFEFDNLAYNPTPADVPEPVSFALLGTGLIGLSLARRKRG